MSVRTQDRGARRLIESYGKSSRLVAEVGVIGEKAGAPEGEGVTVADVATWAEYGIGQPLRSWLRAWVDENRAPLAALLRDEGRAVHSGKRPQAVALARIGVWIAGQMQARIARGIQPPNAESTIRRKGSSKPLIDQGQFRQSITSRVAEPGKGAPP